MTVSFDDIRGEVLPGGHLVARVPGIVVVIRRDEGTGQASSADLLALIRQAAQDGSPAPGRDLARLLTEWVVTHQRRARLRHHRRHRRGHRGVPAR